MRTNVTEVKCDECGTVTSVDDRERTPNSWYRLQTLYLRFRPKKFKEYHIPSKNTIDIDEATDPDFCCRECLDSWLKKQIDKISKS